MNKQNIAVIGSGYWGKNLVRNFHSLESLGLICDKNDAVLEHFRQQYPDVRTCRDVAEVMADGDIAGVAVASPAETHFTLAKQALLAGKHVFVEKPLALDENEGQELIDLAAQQSRTLMIGHLLQYHPVFLRLKAMAASGELGRINYIYSNRLNLGKIRREENILWSFAPHDISMILTLSGEEPTSVLATGGNYLHEKIADVTTTHLEFASGLKAHVFVSWLHPFKEQKLVVVGDEKMAVFDDIKPWGEKLMVYPHRIHWENSVPVPDKAEAEFIDVEESEPLKAECSHFLNCMISGTSPTTDGAEGIRVLKVLNAAQRSLDNTGMRIVLHSSLEQTEIGKPIVHSTVHVDENVVIGKGTQVWHFSHLLKGSVIGENCRIGQNVVVGPEAQIGNGCKIQNNVSVYQGVTLEEDVFCGPSMVFTNVMNPRCHIPRMSEAMSTRVRKGATLGANCTIICGNTIGRYAFVGAGAVVTKDVPDHALVMGNPARQDGWMCQCGERLDETLACTTCGTCHEKTDSGLRPREAS